MWNRVGSRLSVGAEDSVYVDLGATQERGRCFELQLQHVWQGVPMQGNQGA